MLDFVTNNGKMHKKLFFVRCSVRGGAENLHNLEPAAPPPSGHNAIKAPLSGNITS